MGKSGQRPFHVERISSAKALRQERTLCSRNRRPISPESSSLSLGVSHDKVRVWRGQSVKALKKSRRVYSISVR